MKDIKLPNIKINSGGWGKLIFFQILLRSQNETRYEALDVSWMNSDSIP